MSPIESERFEVLEELGSGGQGRVYEARDRETGEIVALKTLLSPSPTTLLRFKREFRAVADIAHPNLVRLGELHSDRGRWFFSMERVRGVPFLDYVVRDTPSGEVPTEPSPPRAVRSPELTDPTASMQGRRISGQRVARPMRPRGSVDVPRLRGVLRQLADGLAAFHGAGQVHRDVKPSNVLVTEEGRVVLLDFGIAVADADDPLAPPGQGYIAGTAAFMAPEQCDGARVDPAADWYAFGVILYVALTGTLPHLGTRQQIMERKQCVVPPDPGEIDPQAPDDLDELCVRLLSIDPADRPTYEQICAVLREPDNAPVRARARGALVGRRDQLGALERAWQQARAGTLVSVLLEGRPGSGKTAIVREFLRGAAKHTPETLALCGRCYEQESVPFKGIDAIVEALAHFLEEREPEALARWVPSDACLAAQLFPVLLDVDAIAATGEPPGTLPRERSFDAVRELLCRVARDVPTVVFVDDMQWIDGDGAALLAAVFGHPAPPPVLLVATVRAPEHLSGGEGGELIRDSIERLGGRCVRVEVDNLEPEAALRLVEEACRQLAVDLDRGSVGELVAQAGGHPMLLQELVRFRASVGGEIPPGGLAPLIRQRVARLSDTAQRLLRVLAVAGVPLADTCLAHALDIELAEVRSLARSLRHDKLVRVSWTGERRLLEAYHDRIREAVADAASQAADDIHRAVHEALVAGGEPFSVADHLATWPGADPALVIDAQLVAGRRAFALGAYERAAHHLQRVREAPSPLAVADLRLWAEALARTRRWHDSLQLYEEAIEAVDERVARARLIIDLVRVYGAAYQLESAHAALERAYRVLDTPPLQGGRMGVLRAASAMAASGVLARARRARSHTGALAELELAKMAAYGEHVRLAYFDNDTPLFVQGLLRLGTMARRMPACHEVAASIGGVGVLYASLGWRRRSEATLRRAADMAEELGDRTVLGNVRSLQAIARHLLGDAAAAQSASETALRELGSWMHPDDHRNCVGDLVLNCMSRGLAGVAVRWLEASALPSDAGSVDAPMALLRYQERGAAHAILGDDEHAHDFSARAAAMSEQVSLQPARLAWYIGFRVLYLMETGADDAAIESLIERFEALRLEPSRLSYHERFVFVVLAQYYLERAERGVGTQELARAERWLRASGKHPVTEAHRLVVRAAQAVHARAGAGAVRAIDDAVGAATRAACPWARFAALRLAFRLHRDRGERSEADAAEREADELARAYHWRRRCRAKGERLLPK